MRASTCIPTLAGAVILSACAHTQADEPIAQATATADSAFVGRYDGSSFETAMGLDIRPDGTFGWGLSVGSLDMRAAGTWRQDGEKITFTSVPKPVPPELAWAGMEPNPDGPMLQVFWGETGEPIQHSSTLTKCADGQTFLGRVGPQGSSPNPEQCPEPVSVRVLVPDYDVEWPIFDLAEQGWQPGMTIRFEFRPNDYNVLDFTGATATLEGETLTVAWPFGDSDTYRKLTPGPSAPQP